MLELRGFSIRRAGRALLAGLDLTLQPGTVTAVLGPNGAGKSSLLLALAGMLPADGEALWSGNTLRSMSRRQLAVIFAWQGELPPAEFGLTVRQRLELAAGEDADEDAGGRIEQAAGRMEAAHLLDRDLAQLSSGERQRVEIAALSLRETPVHLLDEPTAHLDLKHQASCLQLMRDEAAEGRTVITVLHDLAQAQAVADQVILIYGDGRSEAGPANHLMTAGRLQALFAVELKQSGELLLPDYGGVREA